MSDPTPGEVERRFEAARVAEYEARVERIKNTLRIVKARARIDPPQPNRATRRRRKKRR